jgi:hypothetical protein
MTLTTAQKNALLAFIQGDPTAGPLFTDGNLSGLADYLNGDADPAFIVWRTFVDRDTVMLNGFDWARVDNLSVGKARIWEWLVMGPTGGFNPSKLNVRAGIDAVWAGTQADLAVRDAVYVHCKRSASRVEKLFATGTGSNAVPATMAIEGPLSFTDLTGPPFQA